MNARGVVRFCAAVCGLILLGAMPCLAAQSVLEMVPDDAFGAVIINQMAQTDAKIQKLGQQIQMPAPSPLMMLKAMAKAEKGLDEKGSAAVIAMPAKEDGGRPIPVIVLPVSDYKVFVGQFAPEKVTDAISKVTIGDRRTLVANKDGYALFAQADDQEAFQAVLESDKSVAAEVAPWKQWATDNDAVVIVTRHGLKLFFARADKELEKAKEAMASMGDQAAPATAAFDMYREMFGVAEKGIAAVGVGLVIEEDGALRLSTNGLFVPGEDLAKWFEGVKPLEGNALAGLPKGPFVGAVAGPLPSAMMESLMRVSVDMMKASPNVYGLNEEQTEKLAKISTETMKGVQGMSMMLGIAKPGEPLYAGMAGAMWTEDSEAFLNRYAEQTKASAELAAGAEKSPLKSIKVEPIEIDGAKGFKVKMDLSSMFSMPGMEKQAKMLEKMYGEGEMIAYILAADKNVVVFSYRSEDVAKRALAAVKNADASLAAEAGVAATAVKLPTDADWYAYLSPTGTLEFVNNTLASVLPAGTEIKLPPFPETPPLGFSAKVDAAGVWKQIYIPADVVKSIAPYAVQVRAMNAKQQ